MQSETANVGCFSRVRRLRFRQEGFLQIFYKFLWRQISCLDTLVRVSNIESIREMNNTDYSKRGWMLHCLSSVTADVGDAVTAGQVAKRAGVSRNTAKKWLESLVIDGKVEQVIGWHVNGQEKKGYKTVDPCPVCGGYRRDTESWTEERGYGALYRHWQIICRDCGEYLDGGTFDMQGD